MLEAVSLLTSAFSAAAGWLGEISEVAPIIPISLGGYLIYQVVIKLILPIFSTESGDTD